jgi:hypothetical protein
VSRKIKKQMQVHEPLDTRATCQNCRPVLIVDETCLLWCLDLARTLTIEPREPTVHIQATCSSITYKIPRSRFEVAWLSLSLESFAPVTLAAGSLILPCNHFLHRLVLRCLQASSFFFFFRTSKSPVVVVFLLVCIPSWVWRVAVNQSANNNIHIANNLHSTTLTIKLHHHCQRSLSNCSSLPFIHQYWLLPLA